MNHWRSEVASSRRLLQSLDSRLRPTCGSDGNKKPRCCESDAVHLRSESCHDLMDRRVIGDLQLD